MEQQFASEKRVVIVVIRLSIEGPEGVVVDSTKFGADVVDQKKEFNGLVGGDGQRLKGGNGQIDQFVKGKRSVRESTARAQVGWPSSGHHSGSLCLGIAGLALGLRGGLDEQREREYS